MSTSIEISDTPKRLTAGDARKLAVDYTRNTEPYHKVIAQIHLSASTGLMVLEDVDTTTEVEMALKVDGYNVALQRNGLYNIYW